jgi:hypothetical protein
MICVETERERARQRQRESLVGNTHQKRITKITNSDCHQHFAVEHAGRGATVLLDVDQIIGDRRNVVERVPLVQQLAVPIELLGIINETQFTTKT